MTEFLFMNWTQRLCVRKQTIVSKPHYLIFESITHIDIRRSLISDNLLSFRFHDTHVADRIVERKVKRRWAHKARTSSNIGSRACQNSEIRQQISAYKVQLLAHIFDLICFENNNGRNNGSKSNL